MKKLFVLAGVLLLLAPSAWPQQERNRPRPPAITVTGEALISAEPDQAQLDIGVVTQARTAPEASKENAERVTRVLSEVKKLLGRTDEVKTSGYSLTPAYRYPQGGKPEIVGYNASNTLRIKTMQACKTLHERNIPIVELEYRAKGHFTGRELYFHDPSGNRLEIRDPTWKKGMPEPLYEEIVNS